MLCGQATRTLFAPEAPSMKLSLRLTIIVAAIFAVIALGVAITGFVSLGSIADPVRLSDAKGFAWFWTFLAGVAITLGALAWWMSKRDDGEAEDA